MPMECGTHKLHNYVVLRLDSVLVLCAHSESRRSWVVVVLGMIRSRRKFSLFVLKPERSNPTAFAVYGCLCYVVKPIV